METILTKSEFLSRIKDIRALEFIARKDYDEDLSIFTKPEIVSVIKTIRDEEDKHIALLNEIIKLLEAS
jgi:hypothetical protein